MISFILPATDKKQVKKLESTVTGQVIPIYGATSFFDAWRKGLQQATGEYIIFTHQDVEFVEIPDLEPYFTDNVGMLGVAGTTVLHKDQPWWFSTERALGNILSGQIYHRGEKGNEISVFGDNGNVVCLDGVCLITKKDIINKVGIPDIDWATWDFYDHVISLEFVKKGYGLKTIPLIMVHGSKGGNKRDSFQKDEERFRKEYLLDKVWRV